MNNFPLLRDSRCLELDILDILECADETTDLRPTLRNVSSRAGAIADTIASRVELDEQTIANAARWNLLFETPGVVVKKRDGMVYIFRDAIGVDGRRYGRSLLGRGIDIRTAVDTVLGFVK